VHLGWVLYDGGPMLRAHTVRTLDDRVRILRRLVWLGDEGVNPGAPPVGGLKDPRMRQIGLAVTQACVARDDKCELDAIYRFVKSNVRYTGDITMKDTFQTAYRTLQMAGGDCFPEGTLFLTRDGFTPVEDVEEGDEVHDGETWRHVLKTWDRGRKEIFRLGLDNGNDLRLSGRHKVLRVPEGGAYGDAEEVRMEDVRVGDDLLQPRRFDGASADEQDLDTAFLIGAYLAEGCRSHKKVGGPDEWISLAGVANRKMIRERAIGILRARGVALKERTREIKFHVRDFAEAYDLGRIASEKHLPTFRYGPRTINEIIRAMEMGDGGHSTTGYNLVYSTISSSLALQYRVLKRMQGRSVAWKTLLDHGGAGKNAIHRLTVRAEATRRPWAKVRSITTERRKVLSYDIMTSSGRVYLPEADVITRQCDDHSVLCAVLAMENGFQTRFRITSNTGATWDHIFCLAAVPKTSARSWIALDTTLPRGSLGTLPPWAKFRDFDVDEP
jgi:hypothetical protein